jgi:hypothetical protein
VLNSLATAQFVLVFFALFTAHFLNEFKRSLHVSATGKTADLKVVRDVRRSAGAWRLAAKRRSMDEEGEGAGQTHRTLTRLHRTRTKRFGRSLSEPGKDEQVAEQHNDSAPQAAVPPELHDDDAPRATVQTEQHGAATRGVAPKLSNAAMRASAAPDGVVTQAPTVTDANERLAKAKPAPAQRLHLIVDGVTSTQLTTTSVLQSVTQVRVRRRGRPPHRRGLPV